MQPTDITTQVKCFKGLTEKLNQYHAQIINDLPDVSVFDGLFKRIDTLLSSQCALELYDSENGNIVTTQARVNLRRHLTDSYNDLISQLKLLNKENKLSTIRKFIDLYSDYRTAYLETKQMSQKLNLPCEPSPPTITH